MTPVVSVKRGWVRPVIILLVIAGGIMAVRALGLGDLVRLENVARLPTAHARPGAVSSTLAPYIGLTETTAAR